MSKQKDFVKIDDHSWTNLKNGTKGTLIEFAAFHEDISFLQSISKITGNKNLLLLEKHYGEVKRSYKSFYIPKQRQEEKTSSNLRVHNFLKSKGVNNKLADDLFKLNRVQTDKDGSIWLFSEKSDQAAIQYQFDHDKKDYKKVEHGKNTTPFFESYKTGNNLRLFSNPLSFLRQKGAQAFDKNQTNELVLMGLEKKAMHIFLARHPSIKSIELIDSKESRDCPSHKSFYDSLKKDLHLFDIKIVRSNFEKSISKNLSHGIEL